MRLLTARGCRISILRLFEPKVDFGAANSCRRGTGDLRACHLMMEFDRVMLEIIGGHLVVLRSQAQAGVKQREVAIRRSDSSLDDLIPAYKHI